MFTFFWSYQRKKKSGQIIITTLNNGPFHGRKMIIDRKTKTITIGDKLFDHFELSSKSGVIYIRSTVFTPETGPFFGPDILADDEHLKLYRKYFPQT